MECVFDNSLPGQYLETAWGIHETFYKKIQKAVDEAMNFANTMADISASDNTPEPVQPSTDDLYSSIFSILGGGATGSTKITKGTSGNNEFTIEINKGNTSIGITGDLSGLSLKNMVFADFFINKLQVLLRNVGKTNSTVLKCMQQYKTMVNSADGNENLNISQMMYSNTLVYSKYELGHRVVLLLGILLLCGFLWHLYKSRVTKN